MIGFGTAHVRAAVFASEVVAGQTSGVVSGYDAANALGGPERVTDPGTSFQYIVTPFNSPYSTTDLVSVAGGGQLTLKFPNWVNVGAGNEVGVFAYAFLVDPSFAGNNTNPATEYAKSQASIYVSNNGSDWFAASASPVLFSGPANAYTDATDPSQTTGAVPSDYGVPFTHSLSDFDGKTFAQTIALYGNSGGGTWLDLGASGLSQIDYIQFRVPQGTTMNLDAVSINNNAVGAAVPEPASLGAIAAGVLLVARRRR